MIHVRVPFYVRRKMYRLNEVCSLSAKEMKEFGNMLILTIGQKGRSNLNAVLFSTL